MNEPKGGRVIAGKFRLEWPIGRGGMGTVWAAMHLQLDMPVAVKFMDPSAADADGRLRFEREARAIAQLRSPHVVQVLDHGVDNGVPYIVMELLEGEDLESRLRRVKRVPIPVATRIFTQSAKALRRAHDAGIVHRDLKPNNVFLARVDDEEVVKLLDFGVAKIAWNGALDPHNESTQQGLLLGSPCYMSPEQARGNKNIDHRSDLWSLAVILFRSLTGVRPFDAGTIADLIIKICAEPPPVASQILAEAPPGIDDFFFRAFARDPNQRYQSALEMVADFDAIVRPDRGAADTFSGGRIVGAQRTTTSTGMQSVPPTARMITSPGIVITPQRALTNPGMPAVPSQVNPPPYEPHRRASPQPATPVYEHVQTSPPADTYAPVRTSPAASSYVPAARSSYGGAHPPSPPPDTGYRSGVYAAPPTAPPATPHATPPATSRPTPPATSRPAPALTAPPAALEPAVYSVPEPSYPGPQPEPAEMSAGTYPEAGDYAAAALGAPDLDGGQEALRGAHSEPSAPSAALPDSAPHGEGLGTTSNTLREPSPSGRQLLMWTTLAAAVTAVMVVLIVVMARSRYGGSPSSRPQGTSESGAVAPASAPAPQPTPPQPASTDARPPTDSGQSGPGGALWPPGSPSASASALITAPAGAQVPFGLDRDDAGAPHAPHVGAPNAPRPQPPPPPPGKKPPNFGY